MFKKIFAGFSLRRRAEPTLASSFGASASHNPDYEAELTPDLRALRLVMTISDQLLSMDVSAASVVSRALDVTEKFCTSPVHIDVMSNTIMLSQLRGLKEEPLTLIRPVVMRETNNMTVQLLQDLVFRIRDGRLSLRQAENELDNILKHPITYPTWLLPLANAGLAASVDLMFTTNWRIILVTFVIVWLVSRFVVQLGRRGYSTFFRQIAAGAFVTILAAVVAWLAKSGVDIFNGMNPTVIVVGGIIMLVAGLAFVGGIQDAIDEYFTTANAKLLRVVMLTAGVVVGVLIGLYVARKAGFGIAVNPNPLSLTGLHFQIIGGALAAGAFAVSTQTRLRAVIWAGSLGGLALVILYLARHLGISAVPASGVAALVVGVLAKGFSRFWRTPASGVIAASIVPLVPGLTLYNGLMQLVNFPPGDPLFVVGLGTLFTAVGIGLAIAAGASFGMVLARPFSQRNSQARNLLPFANFMRHQIQADHRKTAYLARLALSPFRRR